MILCDKSLKKIIREIIQEPDFTLINPASIDIRIGKSILLDSFYDLEKHDLTKTVESDPFLLPPGTFALVSTYEHITVPNGYAIELKLKSSRAREGFNHSLAFWVDPGWSGILTMEIQNLRQYKHLPIWYKMRFAQIIVHKLDDLSEIPYKGKYNKAKDVEESK